MDEQEILNRWRLVLGKYAAGRISFTGGSRPWTDMEETLDYLYEREYGEEQEIRKERGGGSGDSRLTVPYWLSKIKKLFPRQTVEIMERHALEKYKMTELLTDPEVLRKLEPNKELLKTILSLKHMMKGEVLLLAREIARKVADELTKKMEQAVFFREIEPQCQQPGPVGKKSGYEKNDSQQFEKLRYGAGTDLVKTNLFPFPHEKI